MYNYELSDTKVYVSSDYGLISFQNGNREISSANYKKLKEKIQKKNMLNFHPLIVNENFEIIDGQHRFNVAKELNLPFYFIIADKMLLVDTIDINTVGQQWTLSDFMKTYCDLNRSPYIALKRFMADFDFISLSQAIEMVSKRKGSAVHFKEGLLRFTETQMSMAIEVCHLMAQFGLVHKKLRSSRSLQRAIMLMRRNGIRWDHARLIDLCMENQSKMLSLPNDENKIIDVLEDIYNKRLRTRIKFRVQKG